MTREEKIAFAEGAEERIKGYARESSQDPGIRAAMRRRYVRSVPEEPADEAPAEAERTYSPVRRSAHAS